MVLIEPLYDCYLPLVRRAGAVPRLVRVTPPDWQLDADALAAAFGAEDQGDPPQQPDEPGGESLQRGRARA